MMKANAITKSYSLLSAEERFRLILAAGARGDDAEQDRLASAGKRILLSVRDHSPYAHAFNELALLSFTEFLEMAAIYLESFVRLADSRDLLAVEDDDEDSTTTAEESGAAPEGQSVQQCVPQAENHIAAESGADPEGPEATGDGFAETDADEFSAWWSQSLDLALAAGFLLKTKVGGWTLFCERLNLPPFALWNLLSGFDRVQRALQLTEEVAFAPEGFLSWRNAHRPAGEPEQTAPVTVEGMADAFERQFRERVAWWGG